MYKKVHNKRGFTHQNFRQKISGGFTLLETLVSIAILMVAIGSALTIVPNGLAAGRYARNQITASYLAQEGMEVVRNNRDNGMYFSGPTEWLRYVAGDGVSLEQCLDQICGVNAYINPVNQAELYLCVTTCDRLRTIEASGERVYGFGNAFLSGTDTIFRRELRLVRIPNSIAGSSDIEVRATVTVSWEEAGGRTRTIEVQENLYNWWN